MSFIPDTERLILFDMHARANVLLPVDDLKVMRDAGIGTALATFMDWNRFEPQPGVYDFSTIDEKLERYRAAGMRCLLPIWEYCNSNFPMAWYAVNAQGSIPTGQMGKAEYLLSPWNDDAQGHALEVMQMIVDYAASDTVQVLSSITRHCESVMPADARYYGPAARRSWKAAGLPHDVPDQNLPGAEKWIRDTYTKLILGHQRILTKQHNEAWFGFHLPKRGRINCGVDWFEDYIAAIRSEIAPDIAINHITYTYFVDSYTGTYANLPEAIRHLREDVGTIEWVGAEYCEGLRAGNAEKARASGLRGCIVSPCHPMSKHYSMDPWMVEEIRKAAR